MQGEYGMLRGIGFPTINRPVLFAASAVKKQIPLYQGMQRLGMLVTPELLKRGAIQLENPHQVPFDLDNLVSTCNPGVYDAGPDGMYFFVRAIVGKDYGKAPAKSYQLLGHSRDGKSLKSLKLIPALSPSDKPIPGERPVTLSHGFEDVRVVKSKQDGYFYLIGNGYDGKNCYVTAFRTKNLNCDQVETLGVLGPNGIDPDTLKTGNGEHNLMVKDCLLHPEPVQGKWLMYVRVVPDMQAAKAKQLADFSKNRFWEAFLKPGALQKATVLKRVDNSWQTRLGWGGPPIKTAKGWLHIIHASNVKDNGQISANADGSAGVKTYCAGAVLCDLRDPTQVISRVPVPLMRPETPEEIIGPIGNVIFPQGHRLAGDELTIYYGAADDKVGMAKTSLTGLLDYVMQFDAQGRLKKAR